MDDERDNMTGYNDILLTEAIKTKFDVLDSIIKQNSPQIIVWGYSIICKQFLYLYNDYLSNEKTTIWDRTLHNEEIIDGYKIECPDLSTISEEFTKNGYILLAFIQEHHYAGCERLLRERGVQNIINGSDFSIYWRSQFVENNINEYSSKNKDSNFVIEHSDLYIFDRDMFASAGTSLNDDYLLQDLWAARKIYKQKPKHHYDIGSSIAGFITKLLSFDTNVTLIDIRPLETYGMKNLSFICADATNLTEIEDESIDSLSALCSIEHFGLGRYGDPIDPDAHIKAFKSIQRVMKPGGNVYISVPIAKEPRLVFNAHRIYSPDLICNYLDQMELVEFSYTSPTGLVEDVSIADFHNNADEIEVYKHNGTDLYVTGLFHFVK